MGWRATAEKVLATGAWKKIFIHLVKNLLTYASDLDTWDTLACCWDAKQPKTNCLPPQLASLQAEKEELTVAKSSLEQRHRSREAETKALSDKISKLEAALSQATSHGSAPAPSAAVSG